MQGVHLVGEWYSCAADADALCRADVLAATCVKLARESGLTVLGQCFHQFQPVGVTGVVLLAESHVAIHTWPEHGFATVDVYVCNYTANNDAKAQWLFDALRAVLRPERVEWRKLERGGHG